MVDPRCGWYWWVYVLTGHMWEGYGALQHKLLRCEKKSKSTNEEVE
jgi:hypothetical protein